LIEDSGHCWWLYWCPGLTLRRWQEECRLVEQRFSLFRAFAESPFFGFRGIVSRSGSVYNVTVAAEMDMYPKYVPWVFVTLVAVVSAVEALLDKKSEACPACRQPKYGVIKKFKAFLEQHVPDVKTRFPEELDEIYKVRSALAHGAKLLSADLEYWNFFGAWKQQQEDAAQRNTHDIVAAALRSWILKH